MKRLILITITLMTAIFTCDAAMSKSRIRKEARFLTDKMAYELNLSIPQYNDVYEINYDFIYDVNRIMDEVLDGYAWAMDEYYYLLDIRNDDLRWVLSSYQYYEMMDIDYFYRPIFMASSNWTFRVHLHYTNFNHFYFGKPHHYKSYKGGHRRHHWHEVSYYKNRHHGITHHSTPAPIRHNEVTYRDSRKRDFGSVTIRPNTEKRNTNTSVSRRRSNNDDTYNIPTKKDSRSTTSTRRATSTNTTNKEVEKNTRTTNRNRRNETSTTKQENNNNRSSGRSVRSSSSRDNSNSSTTTRSNSSNSRSNSGSSRSNSGSSRGSR